MRRSNNFGLVDLDDVPDATDNPLLDELCFLGIAIKQAGYTGVQCHYTEAKEGRTFIAWHVNFETPEGRMFAFLSSLAVARKPLPEKGEVLKILARVYRVYAEQAAGAR